MSLFGCVNFFKMGNTESTCVEEPVFAPALSCDRYKNLGVGLLNIQLIYCDKLTFYSHCPSEVLDLLKNYRYARDHLENDDYKDAQDCVDIAGIYIVGVKAFDARDVVSRSICRALVANHGTIKQNLFDNLYKVCKPKIKNKHCESCQCTEHKPVSISEKRCPRDLFKNSKPIPPELKQHMKEYITELSPTVNLIWDNFRRIQHRPLTECEKAYVQRCEELHAEELLKFPYTEAYVERTVAAAAAAPPDQKTPPSSRIEHKDATTNIDSSDSEDEPINYESAIHDDQTAPCFDEYGHEL